MKISAKLLYKLVMMYRVNCGKDANLSEKSSKKFQPSISNSSRVNKNFLTCIWNWDNKNIKVYQPDGQTVIIIYRVASILKGCYFLTAANEHFLLYSIFKRINNICINKKGINSRIRRFCAKKIPQR